MTNDSYNQIVDSNGGLINIEYASTSEVFRAVEQMYGMIWYLAERLNANLPAGAPAFRHLDRLALVEEAQKNYKQGLRWSPTEGYQQNWSSSGCHCGKYAVDYDHCLTLFDHNDIAVERHAVGACETNGGKLVWTEMS